MAIIKTGTTEGTGSAINITLGFVPARVEIENIDGLATLVWTDQEDDAAGVKQVTDGTISHITSNGITPLGDDESLTVTASDTTSDGDTTTMTSVRGFTIGADTDINVSGETINYTAYGLGQDGD